MSILSKIILIGFSLFILAAKADFSQDEINHLTQGYENQFSQYSQDYLNDTPYKFELLRAGQLWYFCQKKHEQFLYMDISLEAALKIIKTCHNFANNTVNDMIKEIKQTKTVTPKKRDEAIEILNKMKISKSQENKNITKEEYRQILLNTPNLNDFFNFINKENK
ncbi:MAG: hypothetical protein ACK5MJ_07550 [Alphaproteobacteria bacterium]